MTAAEDIWKIVSSTASIDNYYYCKDCKWPVVHACCNGEMGKLHPNTDYWVYCSNQGCKNHKGEEFGQNHQPKFLGRFDNDQVRDYARYRLLCLKQEHGFGSFEDERRIYREKIEAGLNENNT